MTDFRLAHPLALGLFLLAGAVIFVLYRGKWTPASAAMLYSDLRLMADSVANWRVRLRWLPLALQVLAWGLLVIALARPQTGNSQVIIRGQGVDIVLALDISSSMRSLDFDPQTRLEAAKMVIGDFVNGREFDRIGLVVFAANAFHYVPPTLDYGVLLRLLDGVTLAPDLGIEDRTAIGLGMASAANMLRHSEAPSKVIILLTDGADNSEGIAPIDAAEAVATLGIRVYTVGMGKPGFVPILVEDGSTGIAESNLDEETLQRIANISEGRYFRAEDLSDLQAIYEQIDVLERGDVERQQFMTWQDHAMGFMVMAFALLAVGRVLQFTLFQRIP